jgi:hypothetical protein
MLAAFQGCMRIDDDHRIHEGGQLRLHGRLQSGELFLGWTV